MASPASTGLTYADLERMPDDGNRYELLDGELFVSPPPDLEHQRVVDTIHGRLFNYKLARGGRETSANVGLFFDQGSHVEPDGVYVRPEHVADRFHRDPRYIEGPPDLVIEVSSPSTRRTDLGRKRELYQRRGVEEYWFVDRDAGCVLVHLLVDGAYGQPRRVGRGEVLHATAAPGFALEVDELFDDPRG